MNTPTLSRRHAFKIAGLAGAAVALRDPAAFAERPASMPTTAPAAALPQGAGFYRTHVGQFEVTIVSDGAFPMAPVFPTFGANASREAVEAVLKDAFLDPAALMGQVNAVLVRRGNGPYTLIDTGCGKLFGPLTGFVKHNLQAAGVRPGDIQSVLLTHLHPDHAGGVVGDDGKPVFGDARHHCHEAERDFWAGPNPDLRKSGVGEMAKTLIAAGRGTLAAIGPGLESFAGESHDVAPGITAVLTGGHTPGHCAVRIESDGQSLLYVGDLIIQSVLVMAHPEWFVAFDTDREKTVDVRRKLFAKLAEERTLICGSHLPFPSLGHVKKAGDGYAFVPAPWRWA